MPPRIMVVDDDHATLEMMEILLKRLGYEPELIRNGLKALEVVKKNPPDLILLDIMMTPIDGWEFLQKLRKDLGMKNIPVILFTAYPLTGEQMTKINNENLGILQKPVSVPELKNALKKLTGTGTHHEWIKST